MADVLEFKRQSVQRDWDSLSSFRDQESRGRTPSPLDGPVVGGHELRQKYVSAWLNLQCPSQGEAHGDERTVQEEVDVSLIRREPGRGEWDDLSALSRSRTGTDAGFPRKASPLRGETKLSLAELEGRAAVASGRRMGGRTMASTRAETASATAAQPAWGGSRRKDLSRTRCTPTSPKNTAARNRSVATPWSTGVLAPSAKRGGVSPPKDRDACGSAAVACAAAAAAIAVASGGS